MRHVRGSGMGSSFALLTGIGLGAGLMALLDPGRGAARRSFVRDKIVRAANVGQREGAKKFRHAYNEIVGSIAEKRASLRERDIPDDQLHERVRAQLGHVVSHFGALEIIADNGHIIIRGPVLSGEREKIAKRLEETRGVNSFDLQVAEHEPGTNIPELQGKSRIEREKVG